MNWLITGGCGFVGSNLAHTLIQQGNHVVVLDDLSRVGSANNLAWLRARHTGCFDYIRGDVRDPATADKVVQQYQPHAIAHLAGQVAMTVSLKNPRLDFETNALGTFNMLEAARCYAPESILLYSSTNKVYGSLDFLRYEETETRYILPDCPDGLDENLPLDGHSPYGCSKLAADQYMRDYHRMYGLRTVVFRHSSMYGGRQYATYDQGWIGWFCQKALEMVDPAAEFTISGDGKQVRDVLHADDLIRVYQSAVEHIDRTAGKIYNIGGGQANSLSLLELFALLERHTGFPMRFRKLDWRAGDQKVFVANIQAAQRDMHWAPQVGVVEGIGKMLQWCQEVMRAQ